MYLLSKPAHVALLLAALVAVATLGSGPAAVPGGLVAASKSDKGSKITGSRVTGSRVGEKSEVPESTGSSKGKSESTGSSKKGKSESTGSSNKGKSESTGSSNKEKSESSGSKIGKDAPGALKKKPSLTQTGLNLFTSLRRKDKYDNVPPSPPEESSSDAGLMRTNSAPEPPSSSSSSSDAGSMRSGSAPEPTRQKLLDPVPVKEPTPLPEDAYAKVRMIISTIDGLINENQGAVAEGVFRLDGRKAVQDAISSELDKPGNQAGIAFPEGTVVNVKMIMAATALKRYLTKLHNEHTFLPPSAVQRITETSSGKLIYGDSKADDMNDPRLRTNLIKYNPGDAAFVAAYFSDGANNVESLAEFISSLDPLRRHILYRLFALVDRLAQEEKVEISRMGEMNLSQAIAQTVFADPKLDANYAKSLLINEFCFRAFLHLFRSNPEIKAALCGPNGDNGAACLDAPDADAALSATTQAPAPSFGEMEEDAGFSIKNEPDAEITSPLPIPPPRNAGPNMGRNPSVGSGNPDVPKEAKDPFLEELREKQGEIKFKKEFKSGVSNVNMDGRKSRVQRQKSDGKQQ